MCKPKEHAFIKTTKKERICVNCPLVQTLKNKKWQSK